MNPLTTASTVDIIKILTECRNEFNESRENGDNKRKLVKSLQDLASTIHAQIDQNEEIESFIRDLWNCPVLLEDCILVSGIIYAKLNPEMNFSQLFQKARIEYPQNCDWVSVALIRGIVLESQSTIDQLEELVHVTLKAVDDAILHNRIVLVSRHLENMLYIYTAQLNKNCYNAIFRGEQILAIVNRTLRLKADLTDYRSRDLIKWHLNVLSLQHITNDQIEFVKSLLDCLPENSKVSIQIYQSVCDLTPQNPLILNRIFELYSKGGIGSAAASCIAKLLAPQDSSDSPLLLTLLKEIMNLQTSRDIIKTFKLILDAVDNSVKSGILKILKANRSSTINQLLLLIAQDDENNTLSALESLLLSAEEFVSLEAFSLLTRDSTKQRRKPGDVITSAELILFQKFISDVTFSGSVDFRQKVSVAAKAFYEQIYARIYFLIRELSKKPREMIETDDKNEKEIHPVVTCVIDRDALKLELDTLFNWLGEFIKTYLVDPFDFCSSAFGSVEFAFTQIIGIFSAFEGNATLVAANALVLSEIKARLRNEVLEFALIPSIDNFVKCVGRSTYDSLRLQAIEIIRRCPVDSSIVPVNEYIAALGHPRAINNEGAARIILLHSNLSKESRLTSILEDVSASFNNLKSDFPASLHSNNINGRLLLLRFLIQERPDILGTAEISQIINLSMEISEFVSVVASHPSPEGLNISEMSIHEADEDEDDGIMEDDAVPHGESVSGQYILSFSWRAVKETSLLLETLVKSCQSQVSKEQIHKIAEHFISLLLKLRHCGAFRALQSPLSTALRLGYTLTEKDSLLKNVLEVCLGTGQITTTRRSAGLPFLVLALAHSCSSRGNELAQLIDNLLPSLLTAATSSNADGSELSPSVIHAFNILRSLVRDSKISNEMGPHMASIAELCLDSFNSKHWSVRNASAMLLSSLITRIFGPKHVNNLIGQDHHVDLREIEVKFDGMIKVITSFLQVGIIDLDPRIAYPLLAILERVRIPPHERFDDFRSVIISFLLELLQKLERHPEIGRKLASVLGRTVFALLHSKSFSSEEIKEKLLSKAVKSTPNGVYNLLVLIENVQLSEPSVSTADLLPQMQSNWHPILVQKYKQVASHKFRDESIFPEQKGSPVLSVLDELSKRLPNIKFICSSLINFTADLTDIEIIYKIIEKLPLNEEILALALPILCERSVNDVDERLRIILTRYASAENNENLRFIVLSSLMKLNAILLHKIPQCVFNLLLDDNDDVRNEMCTILNPLTPLNPAETLRRFINEVGKTNFAQFLNDYESRHQIASRENVKICLFEKEPLNLFIDIQYLRKQFCLQ